MESNNEYLSKKNTDCLKGTVAVGIFVSHLPGYSGIFKESYVSTILAMFAYLFVAVFFFLSGYGVMAQYKQKGERYIKCFFRNRILSLYIKCICLVTIYAIIYMAIGREISLETVLKSLFWGETIIINGWYLQVILLFYAIFCLVFKYLKNTKTRMWIMLFWTCIYCIVCVELRLPGWWYQTTPLFFVGILFAEKKEKVDQYLNNNRYFFATSISILAFCSLFLVRSIISTYLWLHMLVIILSAIMFVITILLLLMKINLQNRFTAFCGTISFEIYVLQGLVFVLYKSDMIFLHNAYFHAIVSFVTTIIVSVLLHPFFGRISKLVKKTK